MLFQSQFYVLVFLPMAVACYYAAANSERLRHWVLIVASLFFYSWWDARFIPLLLGQISVTWLLAVLHERSGSRVALEIGIILNLASLATFKYLDFIISSLETVSGIQLPRANIVLPIGISFFSFQLISYLVDRMRGDAPIYPPRTFALFVLVYPHLIAGPIVRHNELVPQFSLSPLRQGLYERLGAGVTIFTLGFAKKVLLADKLSEFVDPLFKGANEQVLSFGEAWSAALGFSLQLFLDFSAYTEMAIGTALLFGLLLPENFRRPYLSTDIREFWRRWHISLSRFIRDYLYIPLGGSRQGPLRYFFATIVTMSLCGLWHGAGWTYVGWGLWHGVGLAVCRGWQFLGRPIPKVAGWFLTMAFLLVGWVLFRASSFGTAWSILSSLIGVNGYGGVLQERKILMVATLVSLFVPSAHEIKDRFLLPYPALAVGVALLAAFCVLEVGKGAPLSFIYFQF
jgi:alginate O-acetyltransferase complex protein AlgI